MFRLKRIFFIVAIILFISGGIWYSRHRAARPPAEASKSEGASPAVPAERATTTRIKADTGLTPEEQKKYGTDPREIDTDGDGLSDYDEIHMWHASPTKVDTDGDGFPDGYEVIHGYNPLGTGKLKK